MKRKNALITIGVVLVLVVIFVLGLLYFQGKLFATPAKLVEVSNLKIDHDASWTNCLLSFSVDNLYNSPIIAVGPKVNGVNYAYSNYSVPAGQTVDETLIILKLVITNSTNYNVTVAFTFDNGQYQVYSQNILPPKYVGSFFITDESLILTPFNYTVYDLNIQNTGNIPIVSANYTIGNNQFSHNFNENLMPKNTVLLSQTMNSTSFQTGSTYSITLQVRYADGSASNVQSSVPAIASGETPTPSVQTTPTVYLITSNLN